MQACNARFTLQNTNLCRKGTLLAHVLLGVHHNPQILFCKARTYSHSVPRIKGSWVWHLQYCFLVDLHNNSDSCKLRQALRLFNFTPWFLHQFPWLLLAIYVEWHSQCIEKLQRMENIPDPHKTVEFISRFQ